LKNSGAAADWEMWYGLQQPVTDEAIDEWCKRLRPSLRFYHWRTSGALDLTFCQLTTSMNCSISQQRHCHPLSLTKASAA